MNKLKVGMIGGGGDSFFGMVHNRAISLDASRELVAGALRSSPAEALVAAEKFGIKGYRSWREMLGAVESGELALDYVTIVTPNNVHFIPAMAFINAGIPVLCEKPITITVAEAQELNSLVETKQIPFVLAHTYTGHPMMMFAREIVRSGELGKIRKIESWYHQGWLASPLEESGNKQASWRTDPSRTGISNCGGDIGTHAFVAATWVSGLDVKRVSSRLNSFVEGRTLDDDFNVIAEMTNGATAIITATQIALGYRNDNGFRVFGTKGSIEWHQERAESLLVRHGGGKDEVYWMGADFDLPEAVKSYMRVPSGHNEDFFEAIANLHTTMERKIRRRNGEENIPGPYPHPGATEGVAGLKFVAAAVKSSENDGIWTDV